MNNLYNKINKINEIITPYFNFTNKEEEEEEDDNVTLILNKNKNIYISKQEEDIILEKLNQLNIGSIEYINEQVILITIENNNSNLYERLVQLNELLTKVKDNDMVCVIQEEIMLLQNMLMSEL